MTHFPYPITVCYHLEDEGYIATVPNLPGCSAFGSTEEEAVREAKVAAELWLDTAKNENRTIPSPTLSADYSGKFVLRVPRTLHHQLVELAEVEGVSLNSYVEFLISRGVGRETAGTVKTKKRTVSRKAAK